MRLVILESRYAADTVAGIAANVEYARACVRDCLKRNESCIASHLLFTQPGVLVDGVPEERRLGMEAGWAWMRVAEAVVVYTDLGRSDGMKAGIIRALQAGVRVEFRSLWGKAEK